MPVLEKTRTAAGTDAVKKNHARTRRPVKRTMNLAAVGVKRVNTAAALPLIVVIVIAAALFSKFLVYDRLEEATTARREVEAVEDQLAEAERRLEEYGELNDLYAHYTYSGMTDEELVLADRVAAMELLERVVIPRTPVDSWTLTGNQISLSIDGGTLEEINETVQSLLADDLVAYCTVNTAATNGRSDQPQQDDADEASDPIGETAQNGDEVTASIVIYLNDAQEVAR